jgi:hypothetical protein
MLQAVCMVVVAVLLVVGLVVWQCLAWSRDQARMAARYERSRGQGMDVAAEMLRAGGQVPPRRNPFAPPFIPQPEPERRGQWLAAGYPPPPPRPTAPLACAHCGAPGWGGEAKRVGPSQGA